MEIARQAMAVAAVFALLGAVLYFARRGGAIRFPMARLQGRVKSIEAVERVALTPQHALHIVRIHGREVVIATHPQGCTVVSERPE